MSTTWRIHEQTTKPLVCPFDSDYKHLFDAMVFAIHDCGFIARCTLEEEDASEVRIDKIYNIIADCRYGIHDISRTEDKNSDLPRFNMPLELGIFLGAKKFGVKEQKRKKCLILDTERYRYQQFIFDIAGQDIRAHKDTAYVVSMVYLTLVKRGIFLRRSVISL